MKSNFVFNSNLIEINLLVQVYLPRCIYCDLDKTSYITNVQKRQEKCFQFIFIYIIRSSFYMRPNMRGKVRIIHGERR